MDIKEYTIGNIVERCTFDGTGMKGENGGKLDKSNVGLVKVITQ